MNSAVLIFTIIVVAGAMPQSPYEGSPYNAQSCPRRCSLDYYPICGVTDEGDSCVFTNDCYMSMENCGKPADKVYNRAEPDECPDFHTWTNENWNQEDNEV